MIVDNNTLALAPGVSLPPDTTITVMISVVDAGGLSYTVAVDVTTDPEQAMVSDTSSVTELLYVSQTGEDHFLPEGMCVPPGGIETMFRGGIAGQINTLAVAASYGLGDTLVVSVTDEDQNLNSFQIDSVVVTVESTQSSDSETVILTETAADSGVFITTLQSTREPTSLNDCALTVSVGDVVTVLYEDPTDPSDVTTSEAGISPGGLVFDDATGEPVSGVVLTLVDVSTGLPAAVLGDGPSFADYPAAVTTGGSAMDGDGVSYTFAPGAYRFPALSAGQYRLEILEGSGWALSSRTDIELQALTAEDFALTVGSRGEVIDVGFGALPTIDIPVTRVVRANVEPSESAIEFLQYSPSPNMGTAYNVGLTTCISGQTRTVSELRDVAVPVPGLVNLVPTTVFKAGQPIFVRVTDADQNTDPNVRELIVITLDVDASGDREYLQLTETGPNTGEFIGYVQSEEDESTVGSCTLGVVAEESLTTTYVDAFDVSDVSDSTVLVDPFGLLFSTLNGNPIDGVTVTLINDTTGEPAEVFGDGPAFAPYPNTVVTGSTVVDDAGMVYMFGEGEYRFPFVEPGFYRLQVVGLPEGFSFPSVAPVDQIQSLPGAPYQVVAGSDGGVFEVPVGPALHIDLPVDQAVGDLFLTKTAARDIAAIGDFLQYTITVDNVSAGTVTDTVLRDTLPAGFRYRRGSLRINGDRVGNPEIADDLTMTIPLPPISEDEIRVTYVTQITAQADTGMATNTAVVSGELVASANVARAQVLVTDELFSDRSFLVGQVRLGGCEAQEQTGMADIRMFLEDGTNVVTDESGRWHLTVEPGAHVLQVDVDSIPERYELVTCDENTRSAGVDHSRFVDVAPGTLWRVDFALAQKPDPVSTVDLTQTLILDEDGVWVQVSISKDEDVPVQDSRVIYNVPKGWQINPESVTLDGRTISPQSSVVGTMFPVDSLTTDLKLRFSLAPQKSRKTRPAENRMFVLSPRFRSGKALLTDADLRALDQLIKEWSSDYWDEILIVGHTDNVPIALRNREDFIDNMILSDERARNLAEYIGGKMSFQRVNYIGVGDLYPIGDNANEVGRKQNRRVEFLLKRHEKPKVDPTLYDADSLVRMSFKSAGTPRGRTEVNRLPLKQLAQGFDRVSTTVKGEAVGSWDITEEVIEDIARDADTQGLINIVDGSRLVKMTNSVKFDMDSRLTPKLTLDDVEVGSDRIGFVMPDENTGKTLYGYIGVNFGAAGVHRLVLTGTDSFGNERYREEATVVRVGELAKIEVVDTSGNVADGQTPVRVRLKLSDREGELIEASYRLLYESDGLASFDRDLSLTDLSKVDQHALARVGIDGVVQFNPVSQSGTYRVELRHDDLREAFEIFVEPEKRDWIMVGIAEGEVAARQLSDDVSAVNDDDEISADGRVAFYAKGQVRGDYVLTVAYDTDKQKQDSLNQVIDPNRYYTLYGDRTATQYDAASAEKLYLKLEKDQFYAVFGDIQTGLNTTELSTYSRSFTGLKTEYRHGRFGVVAFGSETAQSFIRDEIRGDGTSGLYHLSMGNLVINSEKIVIETRDRFQSQDIVETKLLRRHIDYDIDYDAATLFFKSPVYSQGTGFNPVFIVADYEVIGGTSERLNAGGRLTFRATEQLELGVTAVSEASGGRESELIGVDATFELGDNTEIRAEYATTTNEEGGVTTEGSAYLAEIEHEGDDLRVKGYVREQEGDFGLGQQNASESGTRKVGVEGQYEVTEGGNVVTEVYRQTRLDDNSNEDVGSISYRQEAGDFSVSTGVRTARSDAGGQDLVSNQIIAGGTYRMADGRLNLSANADTPLGGKGAAANFPKRLRVGLNYKVNEDISLNAEQEFTWGDEADTAGTRFGIESSLWQGAEIRSNIEQTNEVDGQRVAAVTGLQQRFDISDKLSVDFGVDRSETLKESRSVPDLAVTTVYSSPNNDDFTAVTVGSRFQQDAWDWSTRLEYRAADSEDRMNLLTDIIHNLDNGQQLLAKVEHQRSDSRDQSRTTTGIQVGYAYRPDEGRWRLFNRLDLQQSQFTGVDTDQRTQKIINNLNANYLWSDTTQVAIQYGLKYVTDNYDDDEYSGVTDLFGVELRHDLSPKWDVGVRGSRYSTYASDVSKASYGVSVGYSFRQNMWLSLGYNFSGFRDQDFSASDYTSQGVYVKYRMKFDQYTAGSIREMMR
ncbi:MAG: OmpA family protein [Pseudomonadota bacterium]